MTAQPATPSPERWQVPFFTIWTGQMLSLVGSRVAMFALIWWLTVETGEATALAMMTLFALLPSIVLGPIAGVYVDRWNRRVTMIVADSLIALMSLWLAYQFWNGNIQVWHVYFLVFARELGGIFHWPAMQSSTALMVPKDHLTRISSVNQGLMGVLNIVGPALGALLLEYVDISHIMLFDVATAAFAVAPLFLIAIPQPVRVLHTNGDGEIEQSSLRNDLREGLHYLLQWRGLVLLILSVMIVKIALTPAFMLLPLLVKDHFNGDAADFARMESLFGVGVVLGSILLGVWGGFKRKIVTMLLGVIFIGVMMLVLGGLPADALLFGVGAVFVIGFAVSFTDAPIMAILQGTITPEMHGRVFMLFGSLISVTSPIGLLISGPVSDRFGIQVWFITAGILCLGLSICAIFIPDIMYIEDHHYVPDVPAEEKPLPSRPVPAQ